MAEKVMTGNLVRSRSRVTWQVHAGFRLTRKPLSVSSGVKERSWTEKDAGERQTQSKGKGCLKECYQDLMLKFLMLTETVTTSIISLKL